MKWIKYVTAVTFVAFLGFVGYVNYQDAHPWVPVYSGTNPDMTIDYDRTSVLYAPATGERKISLRIKFPRPEKLSFNAMLVAFIATCHADTVVAHQVTTFWIEDGQVKPIGDFRGEDAERAFPDTGGTAAIRKLAKRIACEADTDR